MAALFTRSKKCPSPDEWIKKMCYIYIMGYYSTIKNEILSFVKHRMELEDILLSEIRQVRKDKCFMFSLLCDAKKVDLKVE